MIENITINPIHGSNGYIEQQNEIINNNNIIYDYFYEYYNFLKKIFR